jgi:HJR/Mrr/RecB family endonuclease
MGSLFLAGLIALILFLMLAFFARGGPTETIRLKGLPPEASGVAKLTLAELGSVTSRIFSELGFTLASQSFFPDRCDLIAEDPTPLTGQRAYIRCVLTPEAGAVQSAEVQAALDTARGEQLAKAVVVTNGPFSDEARLVSQDTSLELIDGAALAELIRTHLPDVSNRLGLPR